MGNFVYISNILTDIKIVILSHKPIKDVEKVLERTMRLYHSEYLIGSASDYRKERFTAEETNEPILEDEIDDDDVLKAFKKGKTIWIGYAAEELDEWDEIEIAKSDHRHRRKKQGR